MSSKGWKTAPVFPSLRAEGGVSGGYDVKLGQGYPIFLQFKRSHYLTSPHAGQRDTLGGPYYRFGIYSTLRSQQHKLLLALDTPPAIALYAAPEFHTQRDLDSAFTSSTVQQTTAFFQARSVGKIMDSAPHHMCFLRGAPSGHLFSEPRVVHRFQIRDDLITGIVRELSGVPPWQPRNYAARFLEQFAAFGKRGRPQTGSGTPLEGLSEVAALTRIALGSELLWLQRG